MSVDNIGTPSKVQPPAPTRAPARTASAPPAAAAPPVDTVELSLPAFPPEEVLDAVGAAADRVDALAAQNRTLHFELDDATKRVVIQVRDLDGNIIKTIPASEALDIMSGEEL